MCQSCGCDQPGAESVSASGKSRILEVRANLLGRNAAYAEQNRRRFADVGIMAVNLISSPGSGKTSLLERSIQLISPHAPVIVIEGDLQTDRDAARIRSTGVPVYQINTGEGCHLDAHMIEHALDHLPLAKGSILFIENVGNLVCPADFDLGEAHKIVLLSVAEGDDKVEKYPLAFREASALVINKMDLLAHVDFSIEHCRETAKKLNPDISIFEISARNGVGLEGWCAWVRSLLR